MPRVSVIVPVYNSSQHLQCCIKSILCQDFTDFELLLIDDGSVDDSLQICKDWQAKDNRIRIYSQKNGGVSSARNLGIAKCLGEYICFIDSDDWVDRDYLFRLVNNLSVDIDFIQSGIKCFTNEDGSEYYSEVLPEHRVLDKTNINDYFLMVTLPLITSPVSKLYRHHIIKEHRILFNPNLSYGEDRDFNLQYIKAIKTASSISYAGYHYRKGLTYNLSNNKNYMFFLSCDIEYWNKLKRLFEDDNLFNKKTIKYLSNRLFHFYNDRINAYIATTRCSFYEKMKVIRKIHRQQEYSWLCKHLHYVNANSILKLTYKFRATFLPLMLIKVLTQR